MINYKINNNFKNHIICKRYKKNIILLILEAI